MQRLVRRLIVTLVEIASAIEVPGWLDRHAASFAIGAINVYRVTLSWLVGRQCLFAPTCSHRSVAFLRHSNWNKGIKSVRSQLGRCGGNFRIRYDGKGGIVLITSDGEEFSEAELSPQTLAAYRQTHWPAA